MVTLTLDQAKERAQKVLTSTTDSYVRAAKELAEFIMQVQSVRMIMQKDECTCENDPINLCPIHKY
jgi:HJR/Mrr/RecB family endonuclease